MICMNAAESANTEYKKGDMNMSESKDIKKETNSPKPLTKPGDIKGKIDVPDTRERRDGPGGN